MSWLSQLIRDLKKTLPKQLEDLAAAAVRDALLDGSLTNGQRRERALRRLLADAKAIGMGTVKENVARLLIEAAVARLKLGG